MATKTQIGAVIGIEGATQYMQTMKNLARDTRVFKGDMEALTSSFDKNSKSVGQLQNQKKILQKLIENENKKLVEQNKLMDQVNDSVMDGSISTDKWVTAHKEIQIEIDKTTTNLNKYKQQLDELNEDNALTLAAKAWQESSNKTGEVLRDVGNTLIKSVTLPIVGGFTAAVKVATDFESAFTGVRKTVDGTEEELAALREELMKIPLVTASSTEEVMAVAEAAGQLNVPLDAIAEFTKYIIELGDSTNISADEGATSIARFMNIVGVDLKKGVQPVNRFASSLVALGNNSATDEASILALAMRLASAGKLAGLTIPEILGLSAAMSSVGLTAEAGGTAMSTTMNLIAKDVAEGGENLEKFAKVAGTTAEEFAKTWRENPIDALQELLVGMSNLSESGGADLLEFMDEVGWSGIRQSDTMRRLSSDYDGVSEAVRIANANFETNEEALDGTNALAEEAAKRYEDFASKLSEFKESVKQLAAAFGEELLPVLKPIVDDLTKLITSFKELDPKTKANIMSFAGLFAVIGPILSVGGNLLIWSAQLKGAFGALKGAEGVAGVTSAIGGGAAGGGLIGSLETLAGTIADKAYPALMGSGTISLGGALAGAAIAYGGAYAAASAMDKKMYESADACEYLATRYHWSEEKVNEYGYTWDENGHLIALSTQNMTSIVESEHADLLQDVDTMKNVWRDKAKEMAQNQTKAITDETPKVQSATYQMVKTGIENQVGSTASAMSRYGVEVGNNFASGIRSTIGTVANAVSRIASTVASYLHFSEPDVGALSNFHTFMPDMMAEMAQGIRDNMYMVESALGNVTNGMANQLNGGTAYNYGGVNIILNVPQGANGQQLVNEIETELANRTIRRRAVFG